MRERSGRRAEWLAALMLRLKGYRILERRIRTPMGEIDLVARSPAGILCFVEVKWRALEGAAQGALGPRQQIRIAKAAELYLVQRPNLASQGVRFDIITVGARGWPKHLRDAWRLDWRDARA